MPTTKQNIDQKTIKQYLKQVPRTKEADSLKKRLIPVTKRNEVLIGIIWMNLKNMLSKKKLDTMTIHPMIPFVGNV